MAQICVFRNLRTRAMARVRKKSDPRETARSVATRSGEVAGAPRIDSDLSQLNFTEAAAGATQRLRARATRSAKSLTLLKFRDQHFPIKT